MGRRIGLIRSFPGPWAIDFAAGAETAMPGLNEGGLLEPIEATALRTARLRPLGTQSANKPPFVSMEDYSRRERTAITENQAASESPRGWPRPPSRATRIAIRN